MLLPDDGTNGRRRRVPLDGTGEGEIGPLRRRRPSAMFPGLRVDPLTNPLMPFGPRDIDPEELRERLVMDVEDNPGLLARLGSFVNRIAQIAHGPQAQSSQILMNSMRQWSPSPGTQASAAQPPAQGTAPASPSPSQTGEGGGQSSAVPELSQVNPMPVERLGTELSRPEDDDLTPAGVPAPSEIKQRGDALRKIADALATPGIHQMMADIGIAFVGGNENTFAGQLGPAVRRNAQGQILDNMLQARLAGRDPNTGFGPDSVRGADRETLLAVQEAVERQRQMEQSDRQLSQVDRRLDQEDRSLDIREQEAGARMQQIFASLMDEDAVEPLEASVRNAILDEVTSVFTTVAGENIPDDLKAIKGIMDVLAGSEGPIQPSRVRSQLTPTQMQLFNNLLAGYTEAARQGIEPLEMTQKITPLSREAFNQMAPGELFWFEGMWRRKTADGGWEAL